jgi:hypothetical protein
LNSRRRNKENINNSVTSSEIVDLLLSQALNKCALQHVEVKNLSSNAQEQQQRATDTAEIKYFFHC